MCFKHFIEKYINVQMQGCFYQEVFMLRRHSKKISKKGSINLGISTIVVLVIAMVLIAAGISFIRGFFNLGEKKLAGAFEVDDFGMKPDRTNPLVLDQGKIRLKATGEEIVRAGFYNSANSDVTGVIINITGCTQNKIPKVDSLPQDVKPGESAGFRLIVSAGDSSNKLEGGNTYVCTLIAKTQEGTSNLASTQIEIEVYS